MDELYQRELNRLLAEPGNQVPVRLLLETARSDRSPVLVMGATLNPYMRLPGWSEFLARQAQELAIPQGADDAMEAAIVSVTSRLYLDDVIEAWSGREAIESPVRRALAMMPYLATNLVVATEDVHDLRYWIKQAGVFMGTLSGLLDEPDLMLNQEIRSYDLVLLELWQTSVPPPTNPFQWFVNWATGRSRSLLFVGLPPGNFLIDELRDSPGKAPHFTILSKAIRSTELTRFLYARQIRPIWYDPATVQLESLLVVIAESLVKPVAPRPAEWPVQSAAALALAAQNPAAAANGIAAASQPPDATPPVVVEPRLPMPTLPQEVIDACLRNECVLFVGSGLSARAGIPTWGGFVEGLVDEAVALKLIGDDEAEHQRGALAVGEINAVADNAVSAFAQNREALFAYYRRTSTPSPDTPLPEVFNQLRQIPFAGILTTNYDELLSHAYAGSGLEALTPRDSERLLSLLSSGKEQFFLQLYGNLDRPDNVVFAPSDYQDLVRSNVAFSRFIEGLFFSRTMLFVGTSLEGLVDYLNAFQFPSGVPRQHFALVAVRGVGWQAMAQTLKRRYNIVVLPFSISPTFSELDEFLAQLAQHTAHAASVVNSPAPNPGPRLLRIELRNIGPFKHLVLEFNTLWKVLLGDNGVGKSTILKAIAVAIVGSEGKQYAGRLLRSGETLGSVTVYTQKNPSGYVAEIQRVGLEAEVVTRSGRMLETEGWVALAFPPLRATSWVSARGPQGVGARHPTAADLLPMLSGEVDARMDDLKQWLVNVDALSRKEGAPEPDRERAGRMLRSFFDIVRSLTEGLSVSFEHVTTDFRVLVKTPDGVVPIEALSQGPDVAAELDRYRRSAPLRMHAGAARC